MNSTQNSLINLVIALHCEAKPLIQHLKLKKIVDQSLPFPVYLNPSKTIHLVIAGVGKIRMATATAFLFCFTGAKPYSSFLNIGIAGSTQFKIGELVFANKISEISTN